VSHRNTEDVLLFKTMFCVKKNIEFVADGSGPARVYIRSYMFSVCLRLDVVSESMLGRAKTGLHAVLEYVHNFQDS
jgi:hypothetical protein